MSSSARDGGVLEVALELASRAVGERHGAA
jgi:hypothetical protein